LGRGVFLGTFVFPFWCWVDKKGRVGKTKGGGLSKKRNAVAGGGVGKSTETKPILEILGEQKEDGGGVFFPTGGTPG